MLEFELESALLIDTLAFYEKRTNYISILSAQGRRGIEKRVGGMGDVG